MAMSVTSNTTRFEYGVVGSSSKLVNHDTGRQRHDCIGSETIRGFFSVVQGLECLGGIKVLVPLLMGLGNLPVETVLEFLFLCSMVPSAQVCIYLDLLNIHTYIFTLRMQY